MSQLPIEENNQIAIEPEEALGLQELQQIEMMEAQRFQEQLEENSQKMIDLLEKQRGADSLDVKLTVIKNPVSPYMMFVKSWKQNHPEDKFNMSAIGHIWRSMSLSEKQPFQVEYHSKRHQYDQYQATLQMNNLNQTSTEASAPKNIFPLHRVRSIMRQDSFYSAKVQATAAMTKATQYFAEYFLEEIKKLTEGKNRIDAKVLYDCINNNRQLSFLECLIEQYNRETNQSAKQKKTKPEIRLQFEDSPKRTEKAQKVDPKLENKAKIKSSSKPSSGQMSLDSFVLKQR